MRAGIEVRERIPIPDDMIPEDARVEMDAKQAAGYFTVRSQCTVVLRALPAVIVADIFAYIGLCELGWARARCTWFSAQRRHEARTRQGDRPTLRRHRQTHTIDPCCPGPLKRQRMHACSSVRRKQTAVEHTGMLPPDCRGAREVPTQQSAHSVNAADILLKTWMRT